MSVWREAISYASSTNGAATSLLGEESEVAEDTTLDEADEHAHWIFCKMTLDAISGLSRIAFTPFYALPR